MMHYVIDILENELDELVLFGNQMLDSLRMAEKFGWDCEVLLDNIAYAALVIEEKEDELEELTWLVYRGQADTRLAA